jgi:hypothetical protein
MHLFLVILCLPKELLIPLLELYFLEGEGFVELEVGLERIVLENVLLVVLEVVALLVEIPLLLVVGLHSAEVVLVDPVALVESLSEHL